MRLTLSEVGKKMIQKYGLHAICEVRWGSKCKWEHMSRLAVLREWPSIVCEECRRKIEAAWPEAKVE